MDRYASEPISYMPHRDGTQVAVVLRKPRAIASPFVTYTVSAADHMWTLADKFFGDSTDWWVIADVNAGVVCPDDLHWGVIIARPLL